MFSLKRQFGNKGEEIACKFLTRKGYKIVDRNYLRKYGEIDIVAKKNGFTHFIEVKTVSREILDHGVTHETEGYRAEDNLHSEKLRRLKNVIQSYIFEKKVGDWQFGVITVNYDEKRKVAKVHFLKDIIL